MNIEIKKYIDDLFLNIPHSREVTELKEELLYNMSENYDNYIRQGKTEEEAYDLVINDSKDLDEMLADIPTHEELAQEAHYFRKRNAKNTAIGVAMYIIGAAFLVGLGGYGDYLGKPDFYGLIGLLILLLISAGATGLIVYTQMSTPSEYKWMNSDMKNNYSNLDSRQKRTLNNLLSIYWGIATFIYLVISFKTGRWDITWIIWILANIFASIITTSFEIKYGKNHI